MLIGNYGTANELLQQQSDGSFVAEAGFPGGGSAGTRSSSSTIKMVAAELSTKSISFSDVQSMIGSEYSSNCCSQ